MIIMLAYSLVFVGFNFLTAFATYITNNNSLLQRASLTDSKIWAEALFLLVKPDIQAAISFQYDVGFFVIKWFTKARQPDLERCFLSGFTTHKAIPEFWNRHLALAYFIRSFKQCRDGEQSSNSAQIIEPGIILWKY
jgi:hypothetical protein